VGHPLQGRARGVRAVDAGGDGGCVGGGGGGIGGWGVGGGQGGGGQGRARGVRAVDAGGDGWCAPRGAPWNGSRGRGLLGPLPRQAIRPRLRLSPLAPAQTPHPSPNPPQPPNPQSPPTAYGGDDIVQSHTVFLDSHWGVGASVRELVHGVDCPLTAAYMDVATLYKSMSAPVVHKNAICVFESDNNVAALRHYDYAFQFYGAVKGHMLTVRMVSEVRVRARAARRGRGAGPANGPREGRARRRRRRRRRPPRRRRRLALPLPLPPSSAPRPSHHRVAPPSPLRHPSVTPPYPPKGLQLRLHLRLQLLHRRDHRAARADVGVSGPARPRAASLRHLAAHPVPFRARGAPQGLCFEAISHHFTTSTHPLPIPPPKQINLSTQVHPGRGRLPALLAQQVCLPPDVQHLGLPPQPPHRVEDRHGHRGARELN
jgi:hypothetical protein